jgi:hypothetical protein
MDTSPNTTSSGQLFPVWLKIGAVLLVLLLALLFFLIGSARLRHELHNEPVPAGTVPGEPGPVVPH